MPTITDSADRHVVIDRRDGHYLSFPDVCLTPSGKLLCVYREADKHVASRRRLLLRQSMDRGQTWSGPHILDDAGGHCPRMGLVSTGKGEEPAVVVIGDCPPTLYWSMDQGDSWTSHPVHGLVHGIPDRILELDANTFLTTAHLHRGTHPAPATRQPTTEQMTYISTNRGVSWKGLSVLAYEKNLVLCEASITRLPGGRLAALLRENSMVFEPMYLCVSPDNGRTWSDPAPTPLIGHRPCLGLTRSGKLLVTYRNVGPNFGTAAWIGDFEELDDFRVHGLYPGFGNPVLTRQGLVIETKSGAPDGREGRVLYALRPLTDPDRARAVLTARVKVVRARENACGIHLGVWWRIFPDRIRPDVDGAKDVPLAKGKFHDLRLEYKAGVCTLFVDGVKKMRLRLTNIGAAARPILFGNAAGKDFQGKSVWESLSLKTIEPRYGRTYQWQWDRAKGLPDEYARTRILELANDGFAASGDFGYSGWVEFPDGEFFCAYHHAGARDQDYEPGNTAHVRGTRFSESDFG